METTDFAALRRQMVETIAAHALLVGNDTGEQGLGGRAAVYIEDPNGYTVELYKD